MGFSHVINNIPNQIPTHCHLFLEVFIYLAGDMRYVIEGKTFTPKYGDILLVSYDDLHRPISSPEEVYERLVLCIYPNFIQQYPLDKGYSMDSCFKTASQNRQHLLRPSVEQFNKIIWLASQIKRESGRDDFASKAIIRSHLAELIARINRYYYSQTIAQDLQSENSIVYNKKIDKIVQYINDNLAEDLSLDLLAQQFYISKYHLLSEFKKYTSFTVHTYITKKRLMYAKILLADEQPLQDVVALCGYRDYSNFMRAFKKEFGITPMNFAESVQTDS